MTQEEFVEDCWHNSYTGAPSDGSAWVTNCTDSRRGLRGGSWGSDPGNLRSATRAGNNTTFRVSNGGFRLTRTLPSPIGLALGIDGSGSISAADYVLQRDAYVNALTSLLPADGSVAVGVWQFSSNVTKEFSFTLIDTEAKKTALLTAIGGMTQPGGSTAIGETVLKTTLESFIAR